MTLLWIVASGLLMCVIALVGGLALLFSERILGRLMLPMVAIAAGALLGGALFHMLPAGVEAMGPGTAVWAWTAAGFVAFFVLEQFLHWHHCHQLVHDHKAPQTWLLLLADSMHNFLGGLAVGGAYVVDTRLGFVTFLAAVAHEVPQELGDFGVLVQGGWNKSSALAVNAASAATFLVGGVLAWAVSARLEVAFLLPLGAGNFLYIAASDLIPEIKHPSDGPTAVVHFAAFLAGVVLLFVVRLLLHEATAGVAP